MCRKARCLIVPYILMWGVIFILPFFSAEGYSLLRNTTSQLGAQATPNAWIMNVCFILLGLGSLWSGWRSLRGYLLHQLLPSAFSLSLILTAFFRHAPLHAQLPFDAQEDQLHSLFASLTGWSFTFFAISYGFVARPKGDKILAWAMALVATGLSLLMFNVVELAGIWQRLIFLTAFAWMIYIFRHPGRLRTT